MTASFTLDRFEVFALSRAVDGGPKSSLAPMPTRNGLLLKVTSREGVSGWGEAWCNYPPRGNVSKLLLLQDVVLPTMLGRRVDQWDALRPELEQEFARMMIHTGEYGPFTHCIAALDMAAADIAARMQNKSLGELLSPGGAPPSAVRVYCSTPDVERLESLIPEFEAAGHDCFKLKVGFDSERDFRVIDRFRTSAAATTSLCMDANQNWNVEQASEFLQRLEAQAVEFVEEPISADATAHDWQAVAQATSVPLAAGENITSEARFRQHIDDRSLAVVQPDVAKWGGVSGARDVGAHALAQGSRCCLHYMGTALGLAASLHCLAAMGGDGRVELDANPNPLRTALGELDLTVNEGCLNVPTGKGIGFEPDPQSLADFSVAQCDIH